MLSGIVSFVNTEVQEIMKPRVDMTALDIKDDYETVKRTIIESGFSRIPVYEEDMDNIRGTLYVKDLLPYINNDRDFAWQQLIRKPFFVPEHKKINDLLADFQTNKIHMAVVVDEYGGTEGIITLEDILEELVGEIWDEHDEATEDFRQQSDGSWLVSGSASVDDLYETLGLPEDEDIDSNTVNGLVQEKTCHLPKVGDHFTLGGYEGVVTRTARRRVTEVRLNLTAPPAQDEDKDKDKDKRFSRLPQRTESR